MLLFNSNTDSKIRKFIRLSFVDIFRFVVLSSEKLAKEHKREGETLGFNFRGDFLATYRFLRDMFFSCYNESIWVFVATFFNFPNVYFIVYFSLFFNRRDSQTILSFNKSYSVRQLNIIGMKRKGFKIGFEVAPKERLKQNNKNKSFAVCTLCINH